MLVVLPASFSAFTLLPCGHVSARAAPPSFRSPAPVGKDGLRRAAARRAVRRLLPRRGDQVDQVDQVESEQVGSGVGPEFNQERRGQSRALTFTESPEEEAALVKLQTVLSQDLPDASSTAWYPEVHGEVRLLRFLRKAKGRVDVAACRYREMLQWRREADVDAVRSRGRSRGRSLARSLSLSVSNPEPAPEQVRDDLVQQSMRATGMRASDIRHFRPMQRMMPVTVWADQPNPDPSPEPVQLTI